MTQGFDNSKNGYYHNSNNKCIAIKRITMQIEPKQINKTHVTYKLKSVIVKWVNRLIISFEQKKLKKRDILRWLATQWDQLHASNNLNIDL